MFDPFVSPVSWEVQDHERPQQKPAAPAALASVPTTDLKEAVAELETAMLAAALKKSRYSQKSAARLLGLSYDQLRGMVRKYGHRRLGME